MTQIDTHVYVITQWKFCKIGIGIDPNKRLNQLQIGNHEVLELFYVSPAMSREKALMVEALAHDLLKNFLVRGEWFEFNPYDAEFCMQVILGQRPRPTTRGLVRLVVNNG